MLKVGINLLVTLAIGSCIFVFCLSIANAQTEKSGIYNAMIKAWQKRQGKTKSLVFAWTEDKIVPKGFISKRKDRVRKLENPNYSPSNILIPEVDTKIRYSCSLVIKNNKMRYEYKGDDWKSNNEKITIHNVSVFDGKTSATYDLPNGHTDYGRAFFEHASHHVHSNIINIKPFILHYRFLGNEFGNIVALSDLNYRGFVFRNTTKCVLLDKIFFPHNKKISMLVDPSKEYSILRITNEENGIITYQIDIDYAFDINTGWFPDSWVIQRLYPEEEIPITFISKTTRCVINESVESNAFQLDLSPGTRVTDIRHKPSLEYILLDNNKKRMIPYSDIGATYEQIITSQPGYALFQEDNLVYVWLIRCVVLSILISLGFGCFFLGKKLHLRKK